MRSENTDEKADIVLIDTHCHIHDSEMAKRYDVTQNEVLQAAHDQGISQLILIGTDIQSSAEAVEFAANHSGCYATLAIHPHEAAHMDIEYMNDTMRELRGLYSPDNKIVAIGECGLDYYYHNDPVVIQKQKQLLRSHVELAQSLDLPMSFHIRNAEPEVDHLKHTASSSRGLASRSAFEDFFAIVDEYDGVRGVVHSFTAGVNEMQGCIDRGLYIGLNGIMTFTKDTKQLSAAKAAPLSKIVLETDAPFLTPKPFRGKMCEPKHVRVTAEFLSDLRGESLEQFASSTTANAHKLFGL